MSKSRYLDVDHWRAILKLVRECRDLGDDPRAWRRHCAAELARLVDADVGFCGERAGCLEMRPRDLGVVVTGLEGRCDARLASDLITRFDREPKTFDLTLAFFRAQARDDGCCHTRRELIPDRLWYPSPDYQIIQRGLNLDHQLCCLHSIPGTSADEVSGVVLNRNAARRDFSARDRTLVREAHSALAPLIGGPLARFSDPTPSDLTPRAQDVLQCLLEGDGDKQIAARLNLSTHTVNQYVKLLFRHFHVQSRAQLLARWVRANWAVPRRRPTDGRTSPSDI